MIKTYNIDGVDYVCKKNNVVFLRPGVSHSFHIEKTDFVQPHIHFDAVYSQNSNITPISFKSKESMTPDEMKLIQEDVFSGLDIPYVFVPDNPTLFQEVFFDVIESFGNKGRSELMVKSKMLKLLDAIIAQFERKEENYDKVTSTVIANIKNYIDENYKNVLTLDALADMFYVNKFALLRKFKNIYGISIIKYYNLRREDAAKDMLANTNLTIKNIGEILHFTDAYSFSRFFKSCTGLSPSQYRKK